MQLQWINNWSSALTSALSAVGTVANVDPNAAARLTGFGGGNYFLLTLVGYDETGNENAWEIVKVTGAAGGSLTIERAQEGTAATEWPVGSRIELRLTAGAVATIRDTPGPAGPPGELAYSTVITEAGTSRAAALTDAAGYVRFTAATAKSYTVIAQATVAWAADTEIHGRNAGAADLTLTPDAGVTLNAPFGGTLAIPTGGSFTLKRAAADEWDVIGQTVAA